MHYQNVLLEELSNITEYFKHNDRYPSRIPSEYEKKS
jgi:hypothetical protein